MPTSLKQTMLQLDLATFLYMSMSLTLFHCSEPVSPDVTNHPTQPPTLQYNTNVNGNHKVVLREPRGRNVAALAKEIDYKLNVCTKCTC